ncbi:MAG TPA: hypothetical protein VN256_04715 [Pyrinomonadaceae bacterium]|nr:hypothetical protein [Pyrinomonadaceae bacterium]
MSKVLGKGRVSVIMLLALSFALSAACGKSANTGNGNAANTGGTTTTTTTTGGATGGGAEAGKPTAALRAYYEASMRKDVAAAKRYLSASTMRMLEDSAKQMGKTVDEAMEEGARQNTMSAMPEMSNEKISGDNASVDVTAMGRPLTMQMVKEGGEWKIALDKTLQSAGISTGGGTAGGPTQTEPEGGDEDEHGGHDEK